MRRLPNVLAVVAVVAAYAFFGSGGTFEFRRLEHHQESDYASLAEGFREGHLYMSREPDPKLAQLAYPWDLAAREDAFYLWDVSFFNGRYYLYFTPLPVLFFHMPLYVVAGAYPSDALATVVFCTWAFLALVAFASRAIAASERAPLIPFPIWILLIGAGNVVPYMLTLTRTYEVAIATGMAVTAMWALALLKFNQSPTIARVVWLSVWLALSIAARPNLGVLLFITAAAVLLRARTLKMSAAFLAPLAIVAAALIAYNVARFHEPFEFGVKYQLTSVPMEHHRVCSLCNTAELGRAVNNVRHYLFAAPHLRGEFPFVELPHADLDPAVSWPRPDSTTEQIGGLWPLVPLTLIGSATAMLLIRLRPDPGTRAAMQVLAGGWLVLLGLSTCWWIVARYSLDFMLLLIAGAVVCIESGLSGLRERGVRILPLRIMVMVLALYSIMLGLLLGFTGPGDVFKHQWMTPVRPAAVQGT